MVYGEVDDARAAIIWLAAQPGIDPSHIYTFGHSMGGGTSAMLALYPDLPVAITGSCGGIYSTETFVGWSKRPGSSDLVRFDVGDAEELELRVLSPHADQLVHPHVAFLGDQEASFRRNAQAVADAAGPDVGFRVVEVPGDHLNALAPALAGFFDIVAADAGLP